MTPCVMQPLRLQTDMSFINSTYEENIKLNENTT